METVPISETIDRAKEGNKEALSTLYNSFKPRISSYVHAYVNLPYVADDIVSDVFTALVKDIHTLQSSDARVLYKWLHVVADARIADYYRSKERTTDPLDADKGPISWDDPALTIEIQERDTIIHQAIRKLSTDAHKVIIGRIVDGLPARAVASMIGKSPEAVRKIQERGLRYLRSIIKPLLSIFVIGLLVSGGWLFFDWEGNSASRNVGYPVNQPSPHASVTPTPTSITIPLQLPIPAPTPTPTPAPTETPVPAPTPAPTQQTSQTPSLTQDLPVNICVMGVCSH